MAVVLKQSEHNEHLMCVDLDATPVDEILIVEESTFRRNYLAYTYGGNVPAAIIDDKGLAQ